MGKNEDGVVKIRILISPTMRMKEDNEAFPHQQLPMLLNDTQRLLDYLKSLEYGKIKRVWKCSEKLAELNYERIHSMDLHKKLTPAILSFQGLQYQYIAAHVFTYKELDYLEEHLRILSGFYGVLKPLDGVVPYRLEMKSKFKEWEVNSLYDFWADKISRNIQSETNSILNLASKEYSQAVTKYLADDIQVVSCVFGEIIDGKVKQKGTLAKMARGEMVRFMAENQIKDLEDIKKFDRLDYSYSQDLSDSTNFVFTKK